MHGSLAAPPWRILAEAGGGVVCEGCGERQAGLAPVGVEARRERGQGLVLCTHTETDKKQRDPGDHLLQPPLLQMWEPGLRVK